MSRITSHKPDVVVISIDQLEADPLNVTKNIHTYDPRLPVMVISERADAELASRMLRAGAQGFLLAAQKESDLARAIVAVSEGGRYVSEEIMQVILSNLNDYQHGDAVMGVERLTDRELIIFQFIGLGHPRARIARELHVSTKTIVTHQANIKRKMRLRTNAALRNSAQRWIRQRSETP
jgi:DNA-binding NarL/FixJ family response regulator